MDAQSSHRLTILALLPVLAKGAAPLVVLRAMRERGHKVTIAHYFAGDLAAADSCADFAAEGRLINLTKNHWDDGTQVLDELVRREGVELILQIGSSPAYSQLPYLKEMHPGLPIVDTLYNSFDHTVNHFLVEACFDGVIVDSRQMRDYVIAASAKPDARVRIVESGIDLARFVPSMRRVQDGLVIGYCGAMSPEKNPAAFVELAERLHARLPAVSWRMAGEGPLAGAVRAQVAQSRLGDSFRLEERPGSSTIGLGDIDVLIAPSKADGRPREIMEANACGVPVIGAPVGAIAEMIEDGRNGFVISPNERDRIGDLMAGWIADPTSLDRLRTTSRLAAESRFDQFKTFDAYEAAFQRFAVSSA